MIDIHCHILPGLDDGARSLDESLGMARIAVQDGIKKIVATPHIFRGDIQYSDFEDIRVKCAKLNFETQKHNIDLDIVPGAEVHIAHNIVKQLKMHARYLVINDGNYMLLEFPAGHVYPRVDNLFFELMGENIIPIIAHPERNNFFINNPEILFKLLQIGAMAQANSGSFFGLYGRRIQETAYNFLEWRFFHFVGSDGHNARVLTPHLSEANKMISSKWGQKIAKAIFWDNPEAVINNGRLPYVPEPANPADQRKSLKIKLPNLFSSHRKKLK